MIRIKNWSKLQHFKDRTPPWIKLYRDLLDDPDWHELDGETAKLLIGLWLIASEDEDRSGALPDARTLAFRMRADVSRIEKALTRLNHWLVRDDIGVISERYQVGSPETETETKKRQKKGSAAAMVLNDPHALATFKEAWQLHPRRKDSSGGLCPPGNQAKSIAVLLERFKEGVTWDEVPKVAREYQNYPKVKEGYAQNFEVFWGENGHWFQMLTIVRGEK